MTKPYPSVARDSSSSTDSLCVGLGVGLGVGLDEGLDEGLGEGLGVGSAVGLAVGLVGFGEGGMHQHIVFPTYSRSAKLMPSRQVSSDRSVRSAPH